MVKCTLLCIITIIIICIKTSCTCPSWKRNAVYKLLAQPHKHLRHEKLKKTQIREATNGWLHPGSHPAFRYQTQCRECHSIFEPEPIGNTYQIGTFYTLIPQTPTGELLVCWTLVAADGSSLNRQWLEFELTLYNILSPATRHRWYNDKKLWSG